MKKIAIYGGSFDPIHIGHLITATNVLEKLELDELIFIPTNKTPLKNNSLRASNKDRLNMLNLSIKNNSKFSISSYELDIDNISYTYNTISHFRKLYPKYKIYFIIGTDRVKDLSKWYKIEELSNMVTFLFVARDSENIENIICGDKFYNNINYEVLNLPILELSSSDIRKKIRYKKSIDYILTPECVKYIKENKLYEF